MEAKNEVKKNLKEWKSIRPFQTIPEKEDNKSDNDEFTITELSQRIIDLHNLI